MGGDGYMRSELPTWELVLAAARRLGAAQGAFRLAELIRDVQLLDPTRERGTIQPTVQGMTANAGKGPPSPCGTPLIRVDHGVYRMGEAASGPGPRFSSVTPSPEPAPERVQQHAPKPVLPTSSASKVLLISCSKAKLDHAAPARELYASPWFRKARRYAESSSDPWFIVSGKYGLLDPDDVIGPYDVFLGAMPKRYQEAWGRFVVEQLRERVQLMGVRIEIHAAAPYVAALRQPMEALGVAIETPLEGRTLGQWLSWPGYGRESFVPASTHASAPSPVASPGTSAKHVADRLRDPSARVTVDRFPFTPTAELQLPGLYAWCVDESGADDLSGGLGHHVPAGLVYAGQAGARRAGGAESRNTLWLRLTTMHLGGTQEFSTLRRTLSSILRVIDDELRHEAPLTAWMREHLSVSWVCLQPEELLSIERDVLAILDPPLNLSGCQANPLRKRLSALRRV